ncbi:MAG: hypothetical protein ACR2JB_16800 [Bryobacteraceae bacterium]
MILLTTAVTLLARNGWASVWDRSVPSFSETKQAPYMVVMKLATEVSVPIGFEGVPEDPERAITVTTTGGTVRSVLEKLTSADPRYEWQMSPEGIIDILPKKPSERLLDLKISHYGTKNSASQQALDELLKAPEVAAALAAVGVSVRTPIIGAYAADGCVTNFSITLNDVSMRTALNVIVRASAAYSGARLDTDQLCSSCPCRLPVPIVTTIRRTSRAFCGVGYCWLAWVGDLPRADKGVGGVVTSSLFDRAKWPEIQA